jgi:hypothetical protein
LSGDEGPYGIDGPWGNGDYYMIVNEEEFYSYYYDGGDADIEQECEETT